MDLYWIEQKPGYIRTLYRASAFVPIKSLRNGPPPYIENETLVQWFSTFLLHGTLNTRKKFGGTLLQKELENSFVVLIATEISSFSTKE